MARKTNKKSSVEVKKYTRDIIKKSNVEIAKRVLSGEFGEDWKYAVRKLGYSVKAVEVLVYGYSK